MAQVSNFWKTGVAGSGVDSPVNWTEADFARRNRAELTDPTTQGVYKGKLNSLAMAGTGLTGISLDTGTANVYGYFYENDLAVANIGATMAWIGTMTAPVSQTRYDRFVLRANMLTTAHADGQPAKTVRLARLIGTEGAGSAPAVTQNGSYWEISLYTMMVTTGGVCTLTDARTYVPLAGTNDPVVNTTSISTVPYLPKRQGGDPTSWASGGNSNYAVSGTLKMQVGVAVPSSMDTDGWGYRYNCPVTFPDAFSAVPFVMAQLIDIVGPPSGFKQFVSETLVLNGDGPTVNGFTAKTYFETSAHSSLSVPSYSNLRIAWWAVGKA